VRATQFWRIVVRSCSSVHERPPQSGGGAVQCGNFADKGEGFFSADAYTFWCKKLRIFQNSWCVRMDKGGEGSLNQCGHFSANFSRFCADVFYGWLLTMANNQQHCDTFNFFLYRKGSNSWIPVSPIQISTLYRSKSDLNVNLVGLTNSFRRVNYWEWQRSGLFWKAAKLYQTISPLRVRPILDSFMSATGTGVEWINFVCWVEKCWNIFLKIGIFKNPHIIESIFDWLIIFYL